MKNNYVFLLRFLVGMFLTTTSAKPLFAQTTLAAGDIAFVRYVSADGGVGSSQNDEFTFVLLKDITSGTVINFTDYGWTSAGKFQEVFGSANCPSGNHGTKTDGVVSWSATAAYSAGQQITIKCKYSPSANVGTATGVTTSQGQTYYMSLPTGGDEIFAYQGTFASPTLIAGLSLNKNWDASLQACDYTPSMSTLPAALSNSNVAIFNAGDDAFSAYYNCSTASTSAASLRTAINTASNWITNNNDNSDSSIPIPAAFLSSQCTLSVVTTQITGSPVSKTACSGSGATFTVTASNDVTSYQWQLLTGGTWGNLSNTTPYSGVTSATLVISNVTGLNGNQYRAIATGATSATSTSATLTVGNPPQNVSVVPSSALSCTATTVTLTATSTGGTSYVFSGPGIVSQSGISATVNQAGTYTVVATNASSCTASSTTTVSGSTTPPQNVNLTASGPLSCTTTTVTLTGSSTGGTNYVFSGPGVTAQSSTTATVNQAGTYTVIVTNAGGCSASATVVVTGSTSAPQNVSLLASGSLSCTVTTVTLTGSSTGGTSYVFSGPGVTAQSSTTATVNQAGTYTVVVTNASGCSASATTTVTSNTTAPNATLTSSGTLTCAQTSVTLTAGGGSSYTFAGVGIVSQNATAGTAVVNASGTFSVTVTNASGCVSTTSVVVSANQTPPSVSINPTSATLTNASPTASLSAVGTGSFKWSTGATTQVISVTSSGVYSVTLTNPAGCTASASTQVTGSDLTVNLVLPQAQFGASGTAAVGNFVVNVFEVGGLPTSSGNVTITITAPVGYTLSFAPTLTSINVSGGSTTTVDNAQWTVTRNLVDRQITLTMNSGAFISGGGESSLGFSLTRTNANSGSTASISVNVADDLTMTYDSNLANNGYARVISGL